MAISMTDDEPATANRSFTPYDESNVSMISRSMFMEPISVTGTGSWEQYGADDMSIPITGITGTGSEHERWRETILIPICYHCNHDETNQYRAIQHNVPSAFIHG